MNLAARNKDIDLAQDVFDFLGRRDTVFEAQHYEVMLEAYVNADMPTNGFYILSAMQQAGVLPTEGTTRRLFSWLKNNPDRLEEMYIELKNIKESGGSIPVAAVNVLIEAAVQRKKLTLAIDLYKAIPETCVSPANLATFNTLLRLYRYHKRKDLALMLASEMVSAGISPDALTYDRMMLVCLSERDYEDGVRYYREMRAKGFEPRYGSALTLVRTLTKWGDGRVYELLEELQGMDLPLLMGVLRDWVQDNFGKGGNTDMKSEIDGAVTKDHVAKQAVLSVK
jgi:pentatricopeptide repeat protein